MPVYEYEPKDRDCFMCSGRIEVLQQVAENALTLCPHCGLEVQRVVSQIQVVRSIGVGPDAAAKKGFATYRRAERGTWEKVGGEGPDAIVGTPEDRKAVEQAPVKSVQLDDP